MSGARFKAGFTLARGAVLLLALVLVVAPLSPQTLHAEDSPEDPYLVDVIDDGDGNLIDVRIFPMPPSETRMPAVASSLEELRGVASVLSEVPAYDWCYGCSATSAAMLFGYYDRNGYPNMYGGPTNGGVCPLNNATAWAGGVSPLSATRQGYDGLAERGHVDDYWSGMGSSDDPFDGNWTEHDYADCTADFMGTSQYVNWQNTDGSTTFFFSGGNAPLYDYTGSEGSSRRDGCHGMRLFAESRGYSVVRNYNQYIYGWGGTSAGFTWEQYKQEIDAGRPVVIQVQGHSMLGVGYDDPDTVYLHDTWDHSVHSMTWGGSYSGMLHYGVAVLELEANVGPPDVQTESADSVGETAAALWGYVQSDGGESCEYRFSYGEESGVYTVETSWASSVTTGDDFSAEVSGLALGQAYYFVAECRNGNGTDIGSELDFVTFPAAPSSLSASSAGPDSIDLTWSKGEGAGNTQVQRKAGAYPVDRADGVTVYNGTAPSVTDTGLDCATAYYYRAWSEASAGGQWSATCAEATAATSGVAPVAGSESATSTAAESAVLNGTVFDDNGEPCQYRFEYDVDSGEAYGNATTWTGSVVTDDPFAEAVSGLLPGTDYYFRAQLTNSTGTSSGGELSFTTKPLGPADFDATSAGSDSVDLSWTIGSGADMTLIMRKTGSYPADRGDGVQVYLDSGTLCSDGSLVEGTTYYYRAWSYHAGSEQWSEDYADDSAATDTSGTPVIAVLPASFEIVVPPGDVSEYSLSIGNTGSGTLHYTVGESVPPPPPPPPGASNAIESVSAAGVSAWSVRAADVEELIVKFKDTGGRSSAEAVHGALGAVSVGRSSAGRFDIVRVPEGRNAAEVATDYLNSGLVEYVEPNYRREAAWSPDDPMLALQWNLDQVNAENAWDYRRGASSDVIVAVLDTGVAYEGYGPYAQAPDLSGTAFVEGYDFVNGDSHPNDDDGHGTHVTGTIAQTTNNALGVAGLAFGVSIMPVKILDASGSGTVAHEADGIYYAVNHGAHIINLSVGGEGSSQTEADALAYAFSHGVTVVCAAGNDYLTGNDPQYPAAYDDYCIAVGATRYDESRAPYSSTGSYVDIVAPGGDLSMDQNFDGNPDGVLQQTLDGSYADFDYSWWQGTSMACPHVSGAAALILSENRNWGPEDVRNTLESTAKDLGSAGLDAEYGNGLLDVAAVMDDVGGAPWLDESPKEGSVVPAGSDEVTVTVDTTGLADGDYYATIKIGSDDPVMDMVSVPVNLHVRTTSLPKLSTDAPSGVEEETATLHGTLVDDGWESCEFRFEYGTESGGPYAATDWSGNLGDGDGFDVVLAELDAGTVYYARASARNSAGTGYGDEIAFTTKPFEPSVFTVEPDPSFPYYRIDLTWTQGEGAGHTYIRGKKGSPPADIDDGYLVYDGSGAACSDSALDELSTYYYRAWSTTEDDQGADLFSDSFLEASASTEESPSTQILETTLQPGWNMVSLPLVMPDMTVAEVFSGVDAVYMWDPQTKSYSQPVDIEPWRGYWVACSEETTFTWAGAPATTWTRTLSAGWNLIGSVYGASVDFEDPVDAPDDSVEGFAYSWNPSSKSYVFGEQLDPGYGYWVAATSGCSLTVGEAP
ncbi:MAG: S8 family serine peptidase [Dehalococcoidia bacterium]|nr:S8 family serine peptidase [Dehalococcoidia bacterium]